MELSQEQQIAFDKYVQGHNIFITGPGGSGKSELIRIIYKHANMRCKNICVTALTGCASILLNCKAKTLHSWASIGLGNGSIESIILKIKKNKFQKAVWKETDILVVDEVSMLSLKLFHMLNDIGKAIRGNKKPFGGIQLIFSGDFYQLPPVGDYLEPDTQRFCFESEDWDLVFHRNCQIELKKIYRQTDDVYSSILNQIREGKIKKRSNDLLMGYVGRNLSPELIAEPTKLYPTKNKVEQINFMKMSLLQGDNKEFKIKYLKDLEMTKSEKEIRRQYTDHDIQLELDFLSSNLMCEKEMKLKLGAQVMCVINIKTEQGDILICNGSQGIVKDFCEITGAPKIKFNNGTEMIMARHIWVSDKIPGIGVSQIPLILSWALTIHKSQGATLDAAEIDVGSGIFECGQTYVALSRVKSLNGLYLTSFDAKKIMINRKVKEYYESLDRYHSVKETKEEVYFTQVIDKVTQLAIQTNNISSLSNPFINYQFVEAKAEVELTTENYEETEETANKNPNIKIIKFT
jgi:ATP-dependent DNA helicase PIF1